MQTTLSKTLFIGLGGFGCNVIVNLKAQMLEAYGEIPPMVSFLGIDTDSIHKISCKNKQGETIVLDNDEFVHLTVPDVKKLVEENPDEYDFLSDDYTRRMTKIFVGTAGHRMTGRLAFLANQPKVERAVLHAMSKTNRWVDGVKYSLNHPFFTEIHVIFSLAGGTGSGMFIDFALWLNGAHILYDEARLTAFGVLPDGYDDIQKARQYSNALTAITECEFIADWKLSDHFPDSKDPARYMHTSWGHYPVEPCNFYFPFFLINNENDKGERIDSSTKLAELISKSLFQHALLFNTGRISWIQDRVLIMRAGMEFKGKQHRYNAIGYAELVFDSKQAAEYYSLLQVEKICKSLLESRPEKMDIADEVQLRFDEWKIQEDQNRDDVIDFLAEPKPRQRFSGVHEFDENAATAMSSKKGEYISAVRKGLVASIYDPQGKLDQLLGRSLNNLQTFVTEKINKPAGLKYLNLMLPCLIERFKGMMEEITEERKELNQLDIYENTYSTKRSKIEEAANISRFNIFKNRRKLIERACDEFVDVVNEEATCVHEIERRTAAIFFYRKMIDKAEYIKDTVLSYENNLKKIIEKISLLRERLKEKDNTNHYTLNITGDYLEALSLEDKDKSVDNLFSNSNIELAGIVIKSWYGEEGYNALFKLITDACNKHTEKFSELTILDALAKISPERQKALFTDFIKKLGVQSSVHPNFVKYDNIIHEWYCAMGAFVKQTSNREGKSITDGDFLLIDLEKDMDFYNSKKEEELRKNALSNISMAFNKTYGFAPWFSEIGSPDKITLSFYKTAVPAFVVNHFLQYQNDLNPESFSNKHWAEAITQSNYTIFPKDAE